MPEIEVELIEKTRRTIKIKLPIFRKHVVGDYSTIYTRINEDLSAIHITKNERSQNNGWGFEIEYEEKYSFDSSGEDYHLGRGVYLLSEQRFNEILEELRQFVKQSPQLH